MATSVWNKSKLLKHFFFEILVNKMQVNLNSSYSLGKIDAHYLDRGEDSSSLGSIKRSLGYTGMFIFVEATAIFRISAVSTLESS